MAFILAHGDQSLASSAVVFSGGENVNLPVSQLNNPLITAIFRNGGGTSLTIDMDLAAGDNYDYIGFVNHNFTGGTYRIEAWTTSGRTVRIYDSTSLAIPTHSSKLGIKSFGKIIPEQSSRYLSISVSASSGPVDIGRIFVGARLTTGYNMDFGAQMIVSDPNSVELKSQGGVKHYQKYNTIRGAKFKLGIETRANAKEAFQMAAVAGKTDAFMFELDESDFNDGDYTFIGTIGQAFTNVLHLPLKSTYSFQIEEQL